MKYFSKKITLLLFTLIFMFSACSSNAEKNSIPASTNDVSATAIFAGGCFWCMEPPYDKLDGVISTISGYTGGHTNNPNYKQVSSDTTGHYEAIEVTYNPSKIDYATLLNVFWHNVDPLNDKGQFCDNGNSYRTAIFYNSEEQKTLAEISKQKLDQAKYFKQTTVTTIQAAKTFYPAEDYHQDYYQKNPVRYKYYRFACGRDKRLEELWRGSAGKGGKLIPSLTTANE